jgi:hypothetical protein
MRRFAFLAKDHGLKRHYLGGADEHEDRYVGDGIVVTIWLSYPGLPSIVLARRVPKDASYQYRGLAKGQVVKLKRRYYTCLKKNPTSHQVLWAMQTEFADLVAEDVGTAVEQLKKDPHAQLGQEWRLESDRFPTYHRDLGAKVLGRKRRST